MVQQTRLTKRIDFKTQTKITIVTAVIQRVTYPVLSNIQDDKQRMVSAYRRIIKVTMFVTATGMFFLAAISEPMLYCLVAAIVAVSVFFVKYIPVSYWVILPLQMVMGPSSSWCYAS